MQYVREWMRRSICAGLVGESLAVVWAVGDNGWVYECRRTDLQSTYHGYPLLPQWYADNLRLVYDRFKEWVERHDKDHNRKALQRCAERYGFK